MGGGLGLPARGSLLLFVTSLFWRDAMGEAKLPRAELAMGFKLNRI